SDNALTSKSVVVTLLQSTVSGQVMTVTGDRTIGIHNFTSSSDRSKPLKLSIEKFSHRESRLLGLGAGIRESDIANPMQSSYLSSGGNGTVYSTAAAITYLDGFRANDSENDLKLEGNNVSESKSNRILRKMFNERGKAASNCFTSDISSNS